MNNRDNTNSGILFQNTDDWKIVQQGKINLKGEDHRIIGVTRKNKDGQPIVELYRAIGTLKANDDKQGDKSPDAKGVVNVISDTGAMTISAWREKSDNGNSYTSLKAREFTNDQSSEKKPSPPINPVTDDLDDKIPF